MKREDLLATLATQIQALPKATTRRVAIDGVDGAGKTHLRRTSNPSIHRQLPQPKTHPTPTKQDAPGQLLPELIQLRIPDNKPTKPTEPERDRKIHHQNLRHQNRNPNNPNIRTGSQRSHPHLRRDLRSQKGAGGLLGLLDLAGGPVHHVDPKSSHPRRPKPRPNPRIKPPLRSRPAAVHRTVRPIDESNNTNRQHRPDRPQDHRLRPVNKIRAT